MSKTSRTYTKDRNSRNRSIDYEGLIQRPKLFIDAINFIMHNRKRPSPRTVTVQDSDGVDVDATFNLPKIVLTDGSIINNKSIYELFDGNPKNDVRIIPESDTSSIIIEIYMETLVSVVDIDYIAFLGHNMNSGIGNQNTDYYNSASKTPNPILFSMSAEETYKVSGNSWITGPAHGMWYENPDPDEGHNETSTILNWNTEIDDTEEVTQIAGPEWQGSSIIRIAWHNSMGLYGNKVILKFEPAMMDAPDTPAETWSDSQMNLGIQIGCIMMGPIYHFPHSPEIMSVKQGFVYDGVKSQKGMGGHTNTSINFTHPFWDVNGNKIPPFAMYDFFQSGPEYWGGDMIDDLGQIYNPEMNRFMMAPILSRRKWNLEFSNISAGDIFPDDPSPSYDSFPDMYGYGQNSIMKFTDMTMGGTLPFIFLEGNIHLGQTGAGGYLCRQFGMCNLVKNSLTVEQVAPQIYRYNLELEEVW